MIRTVLFLTVTLSAVVYFAFTSSVFDVFFNAAQTDAFIIMLKLYLASCLYCFVVSEVAENYSQVDKFWSTIPIVYVWYFAISSDMNSRMVLMAILVTLWGLRLTLNFARRGALVSIFGEVKKIIDG